MKQQYDPRLWIGGILMFLGVLTLLDNLQIIPGVGDIFWGVVWGLIGLYFLYRLYVDRANYWWAVFPAFALLGLSVSSLLPSSLDAFGGLVFLGGLGLAFWWLYFSDREQWWAIIPGGVLLTLGAISVLDEITGFDNGGILFLGIGLTFILVAILPGGSSRSWALIPGTFMLIFGAIIGTPFSAFTENLLPVVLIALGGYFLVRFFRSQSTT